MNNGNSESPYFSAGSSQMGLKPLFLMMSVQRVR